jgi:hypothetical protein
MTPVLDKEEEEKMAKSGYFKKMGDAEVYESSKYILPGKYHFQIGEITVVNSEREDKNLFIVNVVPTSVSGPAAEEYSPGEEGLSWFVNLNKKSAMSNIKAFCLALDPEATPADIDEDTCEEMISEDQPCEGMYVWCDAWTRTFKKDDGSQGEFTNVKWTYSKENEEE